MRNLIRNLIFSIAVLLVYPLQVLASDKSPDITGAYKIGYRQTTIIDTTRAVGADAPTGGRVLEVSIWYPIDKAVAASGIPVVYDSSTSSLLNYEIPPLYSANRSTLDVRVAPSSVLPLSLSGANVLECDNPFGTACSASTIVGLPVSTHGRFPVLMFSHGAGSVQKLYSVLAEHLASHGYIVVAPRHSGDSIADTISYVATGGFACGALPIRPCYDTGNVIALNRPQDVSFALDKLLDGTLGADLKAAADKKKIGVFGHSLGGYTTLMIAGGLQSAVGSFVAGDLADPRIQAAAAMSALDENVPATIVPAILLPKPNIESIHIPTMVMYGDLETNVAGIDLTAEGQDFFNRLDTAKTGIQYRVVVKKAVHNSFTNFCEQGSLDTLKLGNSNPGGTDALIGSLLFTLDQRIPTFPVSLTGKTDAGYQAQCRNDFFYEPTNLAVWTALGLNGLLLNNPPFSIPLANLPGYIDPDTLQFVSLKYSDEIQKIASGYLVAFFNTYLKSQSQYDRFLKGGNNAVVEQCRQADGKRKCKLR